MAFNYAKLIELRKAAGLTQEEAAVATGVTSGTYRDLETGRRQNPTLDTVHMLATYFGVNVEEFINGGHVPRPVGRPRLADPPFQLPDFGDVPCGPPEIQFTNPPGFTAVSASQFGDERFVLHAKGDSMTGRSIQSGDQLIFRKSQTADHGDVVVAWTGNGTTVKVYHVRGEGEKAEHWLYPASEIGKPVVMTSDYRILGVLKAVVREVKPERTPVEPMKPKKKGK